MNLGKISVRTSERQQRYLEKQSRIHHIDKQTELVHKILDEHEAWSTLGCGNVGVNADDYDEPKYGSVALRKNGNSYDVDTICRQNDLSPADGDRVYVDKYPVGREAGRRQHVIPTQNSGDGLYLDKARPQAYPMSTNTEDTELVKGMLHRSLRKNIMQEHEIMNLQCELFQTRAQLDTLTMAYAPLFGHPTIMGTLHRPPDFFDWMTESTEKALNLKKGLQSLRDG